MFGGGGKVDLAQYQGIFEQIKRLELLEQDNIRNENELQALKEKHRIEEEEELRKIEACKRKIESMKKVEEIVEQNLTKFVEELKNAENNQKSLDQHH